jgi:hypothetical protein
MRELHRVRRHTGRLLVVQLISRSTCETLAARQEREHPPSHVGVRPIDAGVSVSSSVWARLA